MATASAARTKKNAGLKGPLPVAFLFVDTPPGHAAVETLDEAFLSALKRADPRGSLSSRIYRGGLLLAGRSYKPSSIKTEAAIHRKGRNPRPFQVSRTERSDRSLYATLIGDFVETCLSQWNTLDANSFLNTVSRCAIDATIVASIGPDVASGIDRRLRGYPRYIGAVSPDLGNPLQRYLFIEMMYKDAFVRQGRVFVRADWEGDYNGLFFGADTFSKSGIKVLAYEQFEKTAPTLILPPSLSSRGLVTEMRLKWREALSIHQKVMSALEQSQSLRDINRLFEWDLAHLPNAPEEVVVQAAKLADYLLNPDHEGNGGKAKFFAEHLGISRNEWTYLQSQLIDGLAKVTYENVRLDTHGVRFTAYLPVRGPNGATATIETGWIVRPGERASFVTAFPGEKNETLEGLVEQPPVVLNAQPEDRHQAIFDLADRAGVKAMNDCVPRPMFVEGQVIMEGYCGGAYVVIANGRSSFVRWLKKKGLGRRNRPRGFAIAARQIGQSAESAMAYADAFTRVLRRNDIESNPEIYLT
jgi:hypothetical protein